MQDQCGSSSSRSRPACSSWKNCANGLPAESQLRVCRAATVVPCGDDPREKTTSALDRATRPLNAQGGCANERRLQNQTDLAAVSSPGCETERSRVSPQAGRAGSADMRLDGSVSLTSAWYGCWTLGHVTAQIGFVHSGGNHPRVRRDAQQVPAECLPRRAPSSGVLWSG